MKILGIAVAKIVLVVLGIPTFCGAQNFPQVVPLEPTHPCTQQMCHVLRSGVLFGCSSTVKCPRCPAYAVPDATDPIDRMELGIKELRIALTLPTDPELVGHAVELTLARRYITLARAYRIQGKYDLADKAMEEAAIVYRQLTEATDAPNSDLMAVSVAGLIHCGRPLRALEILQRMPAKNAERSYLRAEALFSMGDREGASQAYEEWISSGCDSRLRLITQNTAGGDFWMFLLKTDDMGKSDCENLPSELRSRLEALREQYKHPINLPAKNHEPFGSKNWLTY